MVLEVFSKVLKNKDSAYSMAVSKGTAPFLNQNFLSMNGRGYSYNQFSYTGFSYRKFWNWFRTRPEVYSVISIPINDVIGGKVEFYDINGMPLGRNKRQMAQKFWDDNQVKEVMKAIEFDCFLTGDGYGWKGKLPRARIKEIADNIIGLKYKELDLKQKENIAIQVYSKAMEDEDVTGVKSYMQIPSSTVDIVSDAYKVLYYVQKVAGREQRFDAEEIIHFVLERIDGKINGFSPMQAMMAEMFLLQMIKDNMISFFENGGHPSKIYSLPDVKSINDPSYTRLVDMLQESKVLVNSNGSLIFHGSKLDIEDLGGMPKDMEYKDLAMWVLSNVAFAFEIPTSRMPFLISGSGGAVNKSGSQGLGDAGYWKRVENRQDYLEDVYNNQLFSKMGFKIKFPRGNKQDKIRDTQMFVQNVTGLQTLTNVLNMSQKKLTDDALIRILNGNFEVTPEDLEENPMAIGMVPGQQGTSSKFGQNQLSNMQTLSETDKVDRSNEKRATATNNGISS